MRTLMFDCETNGFLSNLTKMTVLVIRDQDTRETFRFRNRDAGSYLVNLGDKEKGIPPEYGDFDAENNIEEGIRMLEAADRIVGHNIIGFDLKVVKKLYPWFEFKGEIKDTLVLARIIVPDTKPMDFRLNKKGAFPGALIGKHSLDAWGWRLGLHKGDYSKVMNSLGLDPWASWNVPNEDYCVNDVDVTEVLWAAIRKDMPDERADQLEHEIHDVCTQISENGFPFDKAAALRLAEELETVHGSKTKELQERYGFWYGPAKKWQVGPLWEDPEGINEKKTYKEPRTEWGEDDSRAVWGDFVFPKINRRSKKLGDLTIGAPFCPMKKYEFNPNSRPHIINRFTTLHGWVPHEFTETGQPSVTGNILLELKERIPEAEPLSDLFFYSKILGQLKEGKVAWLACVGEDDKIHGYINTGGTVSGRCSHNHPNMGQVPSVMVLKYKNGEVWDDDKKVVAQPHEYRVVGSKAIMFGRPGEFGWECRSLFYTPKEINGEPWLQVGVDLSGIEFRMLAEETYEFDAGALIDVILSGDIHQKNMDATGITDRVKIKRIIYALLYGGGDVKLGLIYDPLLSKEAARKKGKEIRELLMQGLPALRKAILKTKEHAKSGYLIGLDGRRLHCRSQHASFNLRLQSNAALVAKKWVVETEKKFLREGWDHGWSGDFAMMAFVHDEQQIAVKEKYAQRAAELCVEAAAEAGEYFGLRCPVSAESKIGHNWASTH